MHYYIDGYNLLFRLMDTRENLQSRREHVIQDINKKASLTKIDVTLVFDAPFQLGEGSRSHYDALEILFTSHGESADEFLISEIKSSLNSHQETVITSDKALAWRVRHMGAHTQTVEAFISTLNRMYSNKLKQLKTPQPAARKSSSLSITRALPLPILPLPKQTEPSPTATVEECLTFYEQVFELSHQKLIEEEKQKPKKEPSKRKPKAHKNPWPEKPLEKTSGEDAVERWEKIFEQRLKE